MYERVKIACRQRRHHLGRIAQQAHHLRVRKERFRPGVCTLHVHHERVELDRAHLAHGLALRGADGRVAEARADVTHAAAQALAERAKLVLRVLKKKTKKENSFLTYGGNGGRHMGKRGRVGE